MNVLIAVALAAMSLLCILLIAAAASFPAIRRHADAAVALTTKERST